MSLQTVERQHLLAGSGVGTTRRGVLAMAPCFAAMLALLLVVLALTVYAEVPPMSDKQLTNQAALIATGYVKAVSVRDEVVHPNWSQHWVKLVTAYFTVTMEVENVEKGALAPGEHQIQFTGYRNVETPRHWVGGTNTLRLDLRTGDTIKVYLQREQNQWVLFHHMGIWLRR